MVPISFAGTNYWRDLSTEPSNYGRWPKKTASRHIGATVQKWLALNSPQMAPHLPPVPLTTLLGYSISLLDKRCRRWNTTLEKWLDYSTVLTGVCYWQGRLITLWLSGILGPTGKWNILQGHWYWYRAFLFTTRVKVFSSIPKQTLLHLVGYR